MSSIANVSSKKWPLLAGLTLAAVAIGLLWRRDVAALSEPSPAQPKAPAAEPAQAPRVIVREVVREVPAKEAPVVEDDDPILAREKAARIDAEILAQREAYLEAGFRAAPGPDRRTLETESGLTAALEEAGARGSVIKCRSSFCRIEASFADASAAEKGLKQVFMSGEDQRVPNLASTVSRSVGADGVVQVKVYLHPDAFSYVPPNSTE